MAITEIAIIALQKGKSPGKVDSPPGQAWKDILETITSQPGFIRQSWGIPIEDQDSLWLFVDWDEIESYHKFLKSEYTLTSPSCFESDQNLLPSSEYNGPMAERLKTIAAKPPASHHVEFSPYPAPALSGVNAPLVEILRAYFPSSYSESDKQTFSENMMRFEQNAGAEGSSGGWMLEQVPIPGTSENGNVHVTAFGWQSLEAHRAFRETQGFKDNVHLLANAKDMKKTELVHVSFEGFQQGGATKSSIPTA